MHRKFSDAGSFSCTINVFNLNLIVLPGKLANKILLSNLKNGETVRFLLVRLRRRMEWNTAVVCFCLMTAVSNFALWPKFSTRRPLPVCIQLAELWKEFLEQESFIMTLVKDVGAGNSHNSYLPDNPILRLSSQDATTAGLGKKTWWRQWNASNSSNVTPVQHSPGPVTGR